MRIIELEIENIRGIPNINLKPDGKSMVICGFNGSGKSAVVDALDFVLTGHISRLEGEGTSGISLEKHGPHINHKACEAKVRAVIRFDFIDDKIEISRCISEPSSLRISCKDENKELVKFILNVAKNGQHVLTRREILRYIHSEAGSRAKKIQELLNLNNVESIRETLVTVKNKAVIENKASNISYEKAKGQVNSTIGQRTYTERAIIEFVNQNRSIIGGNKLTNITSENIRKDIREPSGKIDKSGVNITLLKKDIENLQKIFTEVYFKEIDSADKKITETLIAIKADAKAIKNMDRQKLNELGVALIDESGNCPLCDNEWEPGKLKEYLEAKIEKGKENNRLFQSIKESLTDLTERANNNIGSLEKLILAAQKLELKKNMEELNKWLDDLRKFSIILASPLEKYGGMECSNEKVTRLFAPIGIEDKIKEIQKLAEEIVPKTSPEFDAWEHLTRLSENLKGLENVKNDLALAELFLKRASCLLEKYLEARDLVTIKIYDSIRDKFVELYKAIHSSDEEKFSAILKPSGASLDLEVDFYGKGNHPPHALHSEGHQDSMGICLYLALAERLNSGLIDVMILDDVVMSVDIEHRKQLCSLLKKYYPNKQFFITTHDKTWANQMKSEGIVNSSTLIEFTNWNIDSGPQYNSDVIMWDEIQEYLNRNKINTASFLLRRGLESFFNDVCDKLQGTIRYNSSHRWELGDWCPSAVNRYHELLKKAKDAANSWNDVEMVKILEAKENLFKDIYKKSQIEQWNINTAVHYNNWENLGKEDFTPVVQAFKQLCGLFVCERCGSTISVSTVKMQQVGVCCGCGKENWNLRKK